MPTGITNGVPATPTDKKWDEGTRRYVITQAAGLAAQTGGNGIRKPAWSPDGKYLAMYMTGTTAAHLAVYDMSNPNAPAEMAAPVTTGQVYGCAFSSTGRYLAVAESTTPFIEVFDTSTVPFVKVADPATLPPGAALSPVWNAADDVLYFVTAATVQAYRVSGGALVKLNNVATAAGTTILAYNGVSELFVTNYITTGTSSAYAAQIANDGSIGSISTATTNDALQVKSAVYLSRNLAMVIAGAKGALFFDTSSGKPAAVTNIKFSGMDYYSCDDMCPTYAVAALLSASSDFIDIADISKPTEAIPIINRIMLPADYGATYGISFSPDGERIAFFHALITLTQGKSVMTIIRNN